LLYSQHQQGLAFIQAATQDEFIAQMLNYQLTPAISFTKGCYTGQEIIARSEYRGKLKRQLYRLQVQAEALPNIGDTLYINSETGLKACGHLISILTTDSHLDILATLTEAACNESQLFTQTEQNTNTLTLSIKNLSSFVDD